MEGPKGARVIRLWCSPLVGRAPEVMALPARRSRRGNSPLWPIIARAKRFLLNPPDIALRQQTLPLNLAAPQVCMPVFQLAFPGGRQKLFGSKSGGVATEWGTAGNPCVHTRVIAGSPYCPERPGSAVSVSTDQITITAVIRWAPRPTDLCNKFGSARRPLFGAKSTTDAVGVCCDFESLRIFNRRPGGHRLVFVAAAADVAF